MFSSFSPWEMMRDLVFRVARIGFVARWFATFDRLRLGRNGEEAASDLKPIPVGIRTELTTGVSARAFIDRPKARKRLVDEVLDGNVDFVKEPQSTSTTILFSDLCEFTQMTSELRVPAAWIAGFRSVTTAAR